jgi:hypothetical protein
MSGAKVKGTIYLINSSFKGDVDLRDARIQRSVKFGGSQFRGRLLLNSADIGGSLSTKPAEAKAKTDVRTFEMIYGSIGGQVSFEDSIVHGRLHMEGVNVGRDFFLRGGEFRSWVDLFFLSVGVNFEVAGAQLGWLDLTGCRIGGELRLGSKHHQLVEWNGDATIVLRNVHADTIQDTADSWPDNLVLQGFTYNRLGGFLAADQPSDIATRDTKWFVEWIRQDKLFTPQPYEQIAKVLRESGQRTKADDILFAGREHELSESKGRRRLWLTAMKLFIGYGYRTYYSLWWVLGLTAIGTLLLWAINQPIDKTLADRALYTFDTLLPIIQLDKAHESIRLEGPIRVYFYFLKAMGFLLGSFIVAGLSGLTKRDGG